MPIAECASKEQTQIFDVGPNFDNNLIVILAVCFMNQSLTDS